MLPTLFRARAPLVNTNTSVDPFLPHTPFNIVRSEQRYPRQRLSQIMKVSFRYLHAWPDDLGLFHYYYQSLVWQNNNITIQSCVIMKQSTDITVHNHIGLQHSSWSSSITYSHCNHFSLSVAGVQTLSVIHNKDKMLILCSVLRVCTLVLHYYSTQLSEAYEGRNYCGGGG